MKDIQRHRPLFGGPSCDPLDLNLRSLDIFVQIAECGGMSTTARRMGLTQSAVSQMIANLEHVLGVQLFDRQVRPLALTPSGVILLEKARGLLMASRDTIQAVRSPDAAFPKLNLCLVDTIAGTIGPDLIAQIKGFATQWSVHAGLSSQHGKALLSREADIIISPDPLEDEPTLEKHEILREQFLIAVPADYCGPTDRLQDFADNLDLIRYSSRSLLGRQVERHLRRLRIEAPGCVEFDTSDAALAMVTAKMGWAVLTPLCALLGQSYWPKVRFLPLPEPAIYRKMFVVARHGELGELPRKIADISAGSLRCVFQVKFNGERAWILEGISIPPGLFALPPEDCIVCGSSR